MTSLLKECKCLERLVRNVDVVVGKRGKDPDGLGKEDGFISKDGKFDGWVRLGLVAVERG